jgi:hypothetical protein
LSRIFAQAAHKKTRQVAGFPNFSVFIDYSMILIINATAFGIYNPSGVEAHKKGPHLRAFLAVKIIIQ